MAATVKLAILVGIFAAACGPHAIGSGDDDGGQPQVDASFVPPSHLGALYATIGSYVVQINELDATEQLVGQLPYGVELLAYDRDHSVLYGIGRKITAPQLVTIDLCDGEITSEKPVTLPGGEIYFIEALDYHKAIQEAPGRLYATASTNGDRPDDSVSESLLEIDPETGIATHVATITSTVQNDGDALASYGSRLLLIDVPGTPPSEFYELDEQTGEATHLRSAISDHYTSFTYRAGDPVLFAWVYNGPQRNGIVHLDPDTFQSTLIGYTHDDGGPYAEQRLWDLAFVPNSCVIE